MHRGLTVVSAVAAIAVGVGACGSSTPAASPTSLLSEAKAVLDQAPSVHFALTSGGAAPTGTAITSGSGDIARPDQLQGRFMLVVSGLPVSLSVLAGNGKFFVQAPFQSSYALTDPATFGVGNPATLLDPTTGLSGLLPAVTGAHSVGQTRIGGEVVDQVAGTVPGSAVPVLPDADRTRAVSLVASIVPGSHQLRQVVLQGPFLSAATSTYTVVLTAYGEAVHVTLPAG